MRPDRFVCWEVAAGSGRADQAGFAGGALYREQDDGRNVRVFRVGGQRLWPPSQETVPTVRITPIIPVLSRTRISVSTPISCLSGKGELRFHNRVFWRNGRTAGQREFFQCRCRYPDGQLKPSGEHFKKR